MDRAFQLGQAEHGRSAFDPEGKLRGANDRLMRMVADVLLRHYPGHPWGVASEIEHGIVKVSLMGFVQWPYVIHISTLKNDPGLRSVVEAGGHLLERFRMPRRGFSMADWQSAMKRTPWHFHRNKKAPV